MFASLLIGTNAAGADETDEGTITSIFPRQSSWSYYQGPDAPPDSWKTESGGWANGSAPFGKGTDAGALNTTLSAGADASPLSAYFRKAFTITEDHPEYVWVNTWADDGIIMWVNGVEVGRANAPGDDVSHTTTATKGPSSLAARTAPVSFVIPPELLHTGRNQIAVQVLSYWAQTPNISFDAHLVREDHDVPPPPPTGPTPPPTGPTPPPTGPTPPPPTDDGSIPGWGTPSWRDEFTYVDSAGTPAVDPTKWNVRGREDLGLLFDAAVVKEDQVTVDGSGILHIRADWMNRPEYRPGGQGGPRELWHETGYIDQRRLEGDDVTMSQPYGRWEIRAKTPSGPNTLGSLAAFWLRNNQSGEIDVMEAWGYDEAAVRDQQIDTATTTVHTHTSSPGANRRYIWHHDQFGAATPVWQDFHTYAFEFTPTYAAVIVDGQELFRATPATHPNLWDRRFFGSPLHMRLNLHVGPSARYWGLPDPSDRSATQNLDYQVDYVRVWPFAG